MDVGSWENRQLCNSKLEVVFPLNIIMNLFQNDSSETQDGGELRKSNYHFKIMPQ